MYLGTEKTTPKSLPALKNKVLLYYSVLGFQYLLTIVNKYLIDGFSGYHYLKHYL